MAMRTWTRLLAMVARTTVLISRSVVPTKELKASVRKASALLRRPMRVYILPSWNLRKRQSQPLPSSLSPAAEDASFFLSSSATARASSKARTAVALSPIYSASPYSHRR
jgi:hypothetical protein